MTIPKKYFQILPTFEKEKTQKFTTIVLTLVALSFFGLFAINPTLSTIAKLKKELADNEFVDQRLQEKITNLSQLQQQYSRLETDLSEVLSSFPQEANVPTLMAEIQAVAINSSIKIKTLQNFQVELAKQNTDLNKKYYSYSFSLSGTGTYESILAFISNLNNMQRVINIDVISIDKTANQNESLRISLQGTAYYKKL